MANLAGLTMDKDVRESGTGFEVIPAGKYTAVISSDELKDNKAGTGKYIELTLQITAGEFKGSEIIDRLNLMNPSKISEQIGQGTLKRICNLCGVVFPPTDSRHLWGKIMAIKVKVEGYEKDGEQKQSNKVTGYSKAESATDYEVKTAAADAAVKSNW